MLGVIATHPSLTAFLIPKNPIDIFFQIYTGAGKTQLSWNDAQKMEEILMMSKKIFNFVMKSLKSILSVKNGTILFILLKENTKHMSMQNNQEKKIFHTLCLYSFMMDISYEKEVSRYTI